MKQAEIDKIVDLVSERVQTNVQDRLTTIFDAKFKRLSKQMDAFQKTWDVHADEWSNDRKDFGEMKVKMAEIIQWFKEVSDSFGAMTKKVVNRVGDQLDKTGDSIIERMPDVVHDSVVEVVEPTKDSVQLKKKGFFKNLFKKK